MEKSLTLQPPISLAHRLPFYYGWVNLALAALAMLATLPGRSIGIGLITEPLLKDLSLERLAFGQMNFWATLLGASFSLLCGPLVDRFGVRALVSLILFCLGAIVLGLSQVASVFFLATLLVLVRGFGQSALSSVSLTIVGKWFVRRLSHAMAVFSVAIGVGFAIAIVLVQNSVADNGWRPTWFVLGLSVLVFSALSWLFVRRSPEACQLQPDSVRVDSANPGDADTSGMTGFTFAAALATPAFWLFSIGSAMYNLVIAGVLLFNQSILMELGFDETVFQYAMAGFMLLGVAGNLFAGWLAQRWSLSKLMSIAMLLLTLTLTSYPHLAQSWQVVVHAMVLGAVGGAITVIFFTAYGKSFGRLHLGKIQGAAQVFAVLASASGPWLLAFVFDKTGSYGPAFYAIAPLIALIGLSALWVSVPNPESASA